MRIGAGSGAAGGSGCVVGSVVVGAGDAGAGADGVGDDGVGADAADDPALSSAFAPHDVSAMRNRSRIPFHSFLVWNPRCSGGAFSR